MFISTDGSVTPQACPSTAYSVESGSSGCTQCLTDSSTPANIDIGTRLDDEGLFRLLEQKFKGLAANKKEPIRLNPLPTRKRTASLRRPELGGNKLRLTSRRQETYTNILRTFSIKDGG